VVFDTDKGEMEFQLRPDAAPNTAYNFRHLVDGGFYTDIVFHRIVPKLPNGEPFVIQVGDPTGTGMGGPGYQVDLEPSTLQHDFGVLSNARSGDPNSNGSQVFVCLSRNGTSFLDGQYTSFAQAVRGGDVIRAIAASPTGPGDKPLDPMPKIKSAKLIDAPPFAGAIKMTDAGVKKDSIETNTPAER
jgi:peptidyl-prolyl cis-trans isomerase B (cyclophilin B)